MPSIPRNTLTRCLLSTLAVLSLPALGQTTANPQVVVPEVERRDLSLPTLPSRDFSASLFAGTYATQNFGAAAVAGMRLDYHITEDFFAELALGQSKVSDDAFRQVLPGGVFTNNKETLSYYSLSLGVNVLPGEVFLGSRNAKLSAGYLVGGIGSTRFNNQRQQTISVGAGLRVYMSQRIALQVDLRDHIFSLDLLGKRQSTQNLEATAAFSVVF
jgi:outer membrane beta-barrel protein